MRRWNGWGDDSISTTLSEAMLAYLRDKVGPATAPRDATLEQVLSAVPESRLPAHPLVDTWALRRLRHASGQSFPDWIALRHGTLARFPDGVARPRDAAQVRALLEYAAAAGARVIPHGGGTSVVGHLTPPPGDAPVLTVDMRGMTRLSAIDPTSLTATFAAGASGPEIEEQLRPHGFVLGHYPQSWEYSTLGGWIATRSSGQQSLRYGRIEQLFLGGRVESPRATLELPSFPASGAGPDLRELVLGSEGRLGLITEATVRVSPRPELERFHAVFMPSWERAIKAVRELTQARAPLSMLRLSNARETRTQLVLSGKPRLSAALDRFLRVRGLGATRCMVVFGVTGARDDVGRVRRAAIHALREHGGVAAVGRQIGASWAHHRFRSPYLRNTLWAHGYGVDTCETATTWSRVTPTMEAIEEAAREALATEDERVLAFTHLSHVYPQGSSIYSTFVYRLADGPDATLARWQRLKAAISRAIVDSEATITHQHGVGLDHRDYLPAEKGAEGIAAIQALLRHFDPDGVMNPGKLVP
ncbi:MAG: FAD-binding oxidoreductase [Myxococcales bacterium]|nr:FAD-binding oxidoreductase [Myxococcales bacterium]